MPKTGKSRPETVVVSMRLRTSDVEKIDAIAVARGVSRARVLGDLVERRSLLNPRIDRGLQLERLRVLRLLKTLQNLRVPTVLERSAEFQKIFDETYEKFFEEAKEISEEQEDGRQ